MTIASKIKTMPKYVSKTLITIIALLIVLRIFLPAIIKHYLNDYLENDMESYVGHVEDVDLSLWRGAYQLQDFYLKKKILKGTEPFIAFEEADISLSWKALIKRQIRVDLTLKKPIINFTDSADKKKDQLGAQDEKASWKTITDKILPFNLASLTVNRGEIHFKNNETKVPIDIFFNDVEIIAKNIRNAQSTDKVAYSDYNITAKAMKQANFSAKGKFDLLVEPLTFDVDLQLKKLDLVKLNPFFKEYGPLDLTSGQLNFFMEMTSKAGELKGYIKPMFKQMDVRAGSKERDDSFKEFGFEIITAVVGVILKNSDTKSLASKIPVSGNLNDPKFDMWQGIKVAVSNGFGKPDVEAKVDKEINVNTIKKPTKKVKEDKQ